LDLHDTLGKLNNVKAEGDHYRAQCPVCGDPKHLYVKQDHNKVLMYCQKCNAQYLEIIKIINPRPHDVADAIIENRKHVYKNPDGSEAYIKEGEKRAGGRKKFWFYHIDNAGGRINKKPDGCNALYNLDLMEQAPENQVLYIVEGEKCADAMKDAGFLATTTNTGGGNRNIKFSDIDIAMLAKFPDKVIIPDNDEVGRQYIQHFPDAKVLDLTTLWPDLPHKGDIVDYIDAGHSLDAVREYDFNSYPIEPAERAERIEKPEDKLKGSGYELIDGCLNQVISKRENGDAKQDHIYLLNGWIESISELTHDNGYDIDRVMSVVFHCVNGKQISAQISMRDLQNGNFLSSFGMDARPAVGATKKSYIADSILAQADFTFRQTIYQQTGWRKIGGCWAFLHAGGAIGAPSVAVELVGRNAQYSFPETNSAEKWDTLQRFYDMAPKSTTYPLLAITFLSPLNELFRQAGCEPSFVMWLQGVTGCMKSTLAALTLCFFGESWNNKSLPHTFKDSANFLEKSGFLLSDVLTVVDDYYPATNKPEANRMAATAQSISRSWGDRVGRSRMNADASLKRGYPARGNLLCTGEDAPMIGQSGAARNFVLELKRGDIQLDMLSYIQANAAHLTECMRDYIEWLIPQMDMLSSPLKARFLELRAQAQREGHGRTIEAISHLQIAIEMFTQFLTDRGQATEAQAKAMQAESWQIFNELAKENSRRILEDKPTTLFLSALRELLQTGVYNVISLNNTNPFTQGYTPDNTLGYKDDDFYYLYPESVYKAVKQFYSQADRSFSLSKGQLFKHLNIENLIEAGEQQTTKQKKINKVNSKFLWLRASAIEIKDDLQEMEQIEL
jgi:hypothetical protein